MQKVDVNLSQPSLVWHLLGCHCQKDRVALSRVLSGLWYLLEHYCWRVGVSLSWGPLWSAWYSLERHCQSGIASV